MRAKTPSRFSCNLQILFPLARFITGDVLQSLHPTLRIAQFVDRFSATHLLTATASPIPCNHIIIFPQ
jgi:hypothetical protein